jgi:hypothetical protein
LRSKSGKSAISKKCWINRRKPFEFKVVSRYLDYLGTLTDIIIFSTFLVSRENIGLYVINPFLCEHFDMPRTLTRNIKKTLIDLFHEFDKNINMCED